MFGVYTLNQPSTLLNKLSVKNCILPFKTFFYKYCADLKIHKSFADPDLTVQVISLQTVISLFIY